MGEMRSPLRRLVARRPPWSFWLPELFASGALIAATALVIGWLLLDL